MKEVRRRVLVLVISDEITGVYTSLKMLISDYPIFRGSRWKIYHKLGYNDEYVSGSSRIKRLDLNEKSKDSTDVGEKIKK